MTNGAEKKTVRDNEKRMILRPTVNKMRRSDLLLRVMGSICLRYNVSTGQS